MWQTAECGYHYMLPAVLITPPPTVSNRSTRPPSVFGTVHRCSLIAIFILHHWILHCLVPSNQYPLPTTHTQHPAPSTHRPSSITHTFPTVQSHHNTSTTLSLSAFLSSPSHSHSLRLSTLTINHLSHLTFPLSPPPTETPLPWPSPLISSRTLTVHHPPVENPSTSDRKVRTWGSQLTRR